MSNNKYTTLPYGWLTQAVEKQERTHTYGFIRTLVLIPKETFFWTWSPESANRSLRGQWSLHHTENHGLAWILHKWDWVGTEEPTCRTELQLWQTPWREDSQLPQGLLSGTADPRVSRSGMYMIRLCADKARAEAQPCKDDKHRQKAGDLPLDLKIVSLPPDLSRLSSPYLFQRHREGGNSYQVPSVHMYPIKYPLHGWLGLLCPGREGETRLHPMSEVMFSYPALP